MTSHGSAFGFGFRQSTTRYVYNNAGSFGEAGDAFAKAVILGGVARRFPQLKFAFLEGGAARGLTLLCDLLGHWEKRGSTNIARLNPQRLNKEELAMLFRKYAPPSRFEDRLVEAAATFTSHHPDEIDDYRDAQIEEPEQLAAIFATQFFFGCEADDRTNPWAFAENVNPFRVRLNAMLASDVGHWDVTDVREVLGEAYELVEDGLVVESDFRDFACDNAIRLHGSMNSAFFEGTAVEDYARSVLSK